MQKDRASASQCDGTKRETNERRLEGKGRRKGNRIREYREGGWNRRRRIVDK